ncbi:MAG: pseudouridine synthase, partial [Bacteroidales bacterium]
GSGKGAGRSFEKGEARGGGKPSGNAMRGAGKGAGRSFEKGEATGGGKPSGNAMRGSGKGAGRSFEKGEARGGGKPSGNAMRGAGKGAGRSFEKGEARGGGRGVGQGMGKGAGNAMRGSGKGAGRGMGKGPGKAMGKGTSKTEEVRLNKYIAASGICSRREADELITAGLISVNGQPVTTLGTKIGPGDEVKYNGERIRNERKVYLLLNKPKDYVTTTRDPRERKTVMTLVKHACPERIYPVGRLDRQTTGVLLFTNDGELAKKLTHPSYNKKKIYHVFLNRAVKLEDLRTLTDGVELEDGFIQPDAISYVDPENKKEIGLEIHSGRNRVVRRMFEALGYRVEKLDRVYFAGLTKKNLPRGKWRFLTETEINRLKMNAYE